MSNNLNGNLDIAKEAAKAAACKLRATSAEAVVSRTGRDIKHQGDKDAEETILSHLSSKTNYPILSEESGVHGNIEEGLVWIVDPLDGTFNYSRGNPLCCVSIGLWQSNSPLMGIVYDFNRGEMFAGIVGEGAWLNEEPIHVSSIEERGQGVLATGFPAFSDFSDQSLKRFIKQVQEYKKIRLFGSAALSLAYVACGRVDAYMENDIMFWDVAAGAALVKAAGGEISVLPSDRGEWMRKVECVATDECKSQTGDGND